MRNNKLINIAIAIICIIGIYLSHLAYVAISDYFDERAYENEYQTMIDNAYNDINLYQQNVDHEVSRINIELENNSILWNRCDKVLVIDVEFVTPDHTIHQYLPCDMVQPWWEQQNKQIRKERTIMLNEKCVAVYGKQLRWQMRLDSLAIENNYEPYPVFEHDTSCYDDSVLGVNDKRRIEIVDTITIHHTGTDPLDVDTAVSSATRHHGVAPAHYFIDQYGEVVNTRPIDEVVGSTLDPLANRRSIHIELVGNFTDGQSATKEQMAALVDTIKSLRINYPNITTITGHRYRNSPTNCPGDFDFEELMDYLGNGRELYQVIDEEHQTVDPVIVEEEVIVLPPQVGEVIYIDNITAYYGPQKDQSFYFKGSYEADLQMNCGGEPECVNAMGRPYLEDHRYTHGACGPRFPKGTIVHLEGRGNIVCADRGTAIDDTDIDIRYGRGEDAMKRIRGGKVHPKTGTITVISLPK